MGLRLLMALLFLFCGSVAFAADLAVLPGNLTLVGKHAVQQLLVVDLEQQRAVRDYTDTAKYTTADVKIASVSDAGVVTPVADGETTITAQTNNRTATIKVAVSKTNEPFAWNFRNHVQATLTRNGCNSGACHGALAGKGGFKLSLRAYNPESDYFAITRQSLARRIDTTQATDSLLLKKAMRTLPHGGGTRFGEDSKHFQVVREWIAAGAPGPSSADPKLERLVVNPPSARVKPQDKLRVIVQGIYSDGTVSDVTEWTKFTSSEEQVASVDEDGKITAIGHGEAGISALFGSRVATITVTSPFMNKVDASTFANSPKSNFIDGHVLNKLQLLNLLPSAPCTDAEFIRRVFLDTCGVLPTPVEVEKFILDTGTDKRARLIDALLERPEYVDYWAHKWSDLMLVSSRKLPSSAMWAFYNSVRRSVANNQPWDRFARDIITASGSTLTEGGGNYFVLHKDISDLVESTTVTFLGMSVNCCRCHNHPLEKWTQDQYWAQANLFSRVGLKNGTRTGEVIVQTLPAGDAPHLRTGQPMPPTPLDGKPLSLDSSIDRRQYYADWLTAPENPYFAKALVNRVWRNFLGRGLVEAEDDMRETNPPTNRELFDALTKDFIEHKFDVKHLVRTIVNSAAYQRSSNPLPGNVADDRYYSRYLIRRLSAEVILDAYADITGVPTAFTQVSLGPSGGLAGASYPNGTRAMQLPDSLLVSRFLDAFGRAERSQTCACERTGDSSVGQALHLNNGLTLNEKLRNPKSRMAEWLKAKTTDDEIITQVFRYALARSPSVDEKSRFAAIIADATKDGSNTRQEAIEDVFWAVLTGKEFLFNH